MAQRKSEKKPEITPEVIETEEVKVEATEVKEEPEAAPEKKESEARPVVTEKTVEISELPDYAKRVLKLYADQPALYITPKGGAFTLNSKPSERGKAILYQNPYYKNS